MSSNEEVVAELISKLTADVSEYTKGMQASVDEAKKSADAVEKHSKKVEGFASKLGDYARTAMGALASLGAMDFLKDSFGKFQEAELGALRLQAALESNGREVEATMKDYEEFAASMQEITTLDDDAVLSLLRVDELFSLTGESAKRAAKDAIALGAATNQSAESMVRMTAAMEQGHVEEAMAFARMIPQLRGVRDQAEFITRYNELIKIGFKTAAAEAASSSGQIKQLTNAYDNLKEEIGGVVAEAINPLVGMLKDLVKGFADLDPNLKRFIVLLGISTAAVIVLWTAINTGMLVFNMLSGGVLILIGAIVAGVAAIALWASQFESLGEAVNVAKKYIQKLIDNWKMLFPVIAMTISLVKSLWPILVDLWEEVSSEAISAWGDIEAAVNEFMEFVGPILHEVKRLGEELWNRLKDLGIRYVRNQIDGFKQLIYWIKEAYNWIRNLAGKFGDLEIAGLKVTDWFTKFRDLIKNQITMLRLMADSWWDVFQLIGHIVALAMVQIYEDIKHVLTVTGLALFVYFANQVFNVFRAVGNFIKDVFVNLIEKLGQSIEQLPEILKDKSRLGEIWKNAIPAGKFELKLDVVPDLPKRAVGQFEQQLIDAIEQIKARLKLRLEALGFEPQPELKSWWDRLLDGMADKAKLVGDQLGNGIKDAKAELERFDAALYRSAEARTRLEHYRERLKGYGTIPPVAVPPVPEAVVPPMPVAPPMPAVPNIPPAPVVPPMAQIPPNVPAVPPMPPAVLQAPAVAAPAQNIPAVRPIPEVPAPEIKGPQIPQAIQLLAPDFSQLTAALKTPQPPKPADVMMFENRQQPMPVTIEQDDRRETNTEQVALLKNIRDIAKDEAAKPVMRVEILNLEG